MMASPSPRPSPRGRGGLLPSAMLAAAENARGGASVVGGAVLPLFRIKNDFALALHRYAMAVPCGVGRRFLAGGGL
jgi:hypothetical protein